VSARRAGRARPASKTSYPIVALDPSMRISKETERRFVLGLQGLWPGRRWRRREGIRNAISTCRRVQVDPLDVVGRHQDLVLSSRVADYRSADLDTLLYRERAAFEHGGNLDIYPRDRLALQWSWVHHEGLPVRWEKWGRANAAAVRRVRQQIDRHGASEARDWVDGQPVDDYRSRRREGMALHYLWRRFEVMVHHREGNRKFYDLTERLFGSLPVTFPREETRDRLALETLGWLGISGRYGIQFLRTNEEGRGRSRVPKRQIRDRLVADGRLAEVWVDGAREPSVLRAEDRPLLDAVAHGEVPKAWRPLTTESETVFLGPHDIVAAHGRARELFGFEYLWEGYKPVAHRRWGYYVLPILLGDRLIGRIEPRFDRGTHELRVERAWWEDGVDLRPVVGPFARGIGRTAGVLGAAAVRLGDVGPSSFRTAVREQLPEPGRAREP
jgi:uncharacterized protein